MWWALFGIGAVAAFLLKFISTVERATPTLPSVADRVGAAIKGLDWTDPTSIHDAATVAEAEGHHETARALRSTAKDATEVADALTKAATELLPSPIAGVADKAWTAFVRLFRGPDVSEISPAYQLGLFNVGFLRLRDLGLAVDVKQGTHNGKTVWFGQLKPPMTVKAFLANPVVQYKVFVKDMSERAIHIQSKYPQAIGAEFEGSKATLSGLLAVIKLAGTKGFDGWLNEGEQRAKFKQTTAAFKAANGIF